LGIFLETPAGGRSSGIFRSRPLLYIMERSAGQRRAKARAQTHAQALSAEHGEDPSFDGSEPVIKLQAGDPQDFHAHPTGARSAALEESGFEGAQNALRRWGPGERRILPSVVSRRESLGRVPRAAHAFRLRSNGNHVWSGWGLGEWAGTPFPERDETADVSLARFEARCRGSAMSRRGCNGERAAGFPCQDCGYYPAHLAQSTKHHSCTECYRYDRV
jgi:hypothetical protein